MKNIIELHQVLSDIFELDITEIDSSASVDTIETWDSMRHLNLVLALEEKFNISFTEDQTVEMLNYELIILILSEHGITFSRV